jgi:hypothetical protein
LQEFIKELLNEYEKADGFRKKPTYVEFKKHFANDKRLVEALTAFDVEKYFNAKLEVVQKKLIDGN